MKTAIEELRGMIERMTQNGGDYDLLCVLGLIDDKFSYIEKQQIIDAYNAAIKNTVPSESFTTKTAEQYYEE